MMDGFVKNILKLVSKNEITEENAFNLIKEYKKRIDVSEQLKNQDNNKEFDDIAIIGIACRFPRAYTKEEYWQNLIEGVDSVRKFPPNRLALVRPFIDEEKVDKIIPAGYIDNIEVFDAEFFNILPGEAKYMDPQQRLFMEVGYEAIEDAGYGGERIRNSKVGIYVGFSEPRYSEIIEENMAAAFVGNFPPITASRLSYALNLSGPAISVATACSSSLVAVHLACMGLNMGDCETALVGGVAISPLPGQNAQRDIGITSHEGKSRSFDAAANGTGWGEGCGTLLLKPLKKAFKDKDYIYAVIKGSAINQDGTSNGLASPNACAQEEVIAEAWKRAKVDPLSISYIEAHGTGTRIGDPIEVKGITNAFRRYTKNRQFCALGSVKSNMGHLDSASGIAGLIKTVMALKNKKLPPLLHFKRPNPLMNLENSSLYINSHASSWSRGSSSPLRAGVSSFGISGTNCHLVVEEYNNDFLDEEASGKEFVFTISAKNRYSLGDIVKKYIDFLDSGNGYSIKQICSLVNRGREHFEYRLALVVSDKSEVSNKLKCFYEGLEKTTWKGFKEKGIFYSHSDDEKLTAEVSSNRAYGDAQMYVQYKTVKWSEYYSGDVIKVPLPTYAWNKKKYWIDPPRVKSVLLGEGSKILSNDRSQMELEYSASNIELGLKEIWQSILGAEDIGRDDDFFELGGDSLLATDLVATIEKSFQVNLSITDIFQKSSFSKIIGLIKELRGGGVKDRYSSRIAPTSKMAFYPVSSGQKRQFILNQIASNSVSYNMPCATVITGKLDIEKIKKIFTALVERHQSFRTIFDIEEDGIVQKVVSQRKIDIISSEIEAVDVEKTIEEFIRPFDLGTSPLLRLGVYKMKNPGFEEERHLFIFDMHHIISDGVSMEILIKEFSVLYEGQDLPPMEFQYKDYAVWQNEFLNSEEIKKQEKFWLSSLKSEADSEIPILDMPTDYPRPLVMTFEGETHSFTIHREAVKQLKKLGIENGGTLYMTLLAIYYTLLLHYTGQEDIIVGTLISGRRSREFEKVIGLFTNYLPLRNYPKKDLIFIDFLREVVSRAIDAYDNQDYPFEKNVELLGKQWDVSRNPIFNTMLILHNQGIQNKRIKLKDITIELMDWRKSSSTLDFKLDVFQGTDGELNCTIEYYSRLFKRDTIIMFSEHFQKIINLVLQNPNQRLSDYDILSHEDRVVIEEKKKAAPGKELPPITSIPYEEKYLISYQQRRVIGKGRAVHNFVGDLVLEGKVDATNLKKSLELIEISNSNLRTTLIDGSEKGGQRIRAKLELDYEFIDYSYEKNPDSVLDKVLKEAYCHQFDLVEKPLWLTKLLKLDKSAYHLVIVLHPIILECFSMTDFLLALNSLYKELMDIDTINSHEDISDYSNLKSKMKYNPTRLVDYGCWQHKLIKEGYLESHKKFWNNVFDKPVPQIYLPTKKSENQYLDNIFKTFSFDIKEIHRVSLEKFASRNNSTLSNVFLSCYCLLLKQLTQAEELIISIFSNKNRNIQSRAVPGDINTPIPMRLNMGEISSFNDLLKLVKKSQNDAAKNIIYPLGLLFNEDFEAQDQLFRLQYWVEEWNDELLDCTITESKVYYPEKPLLRLAYVKKGKLARLSFNWDGMILEDSFVHTMAKRYKKIIKTIVKSVDNDNK